MSKNFHRDYADSVGHFCQSLPPELGITTQAVDAYFRACLLYTSILFVPSFLLSAKNTVTGIAQAGNNIADLIEVAVHSAAVDIHLRILLLKALNSLRSSQKHHELDIGAAVLLHEAEMCIRDRDRKCPGSNGARRQKSGASSGTAPCLHSEALRSTGGPGGGSALFLSGGSGSSAA